MESSPSCSFCSKSADEAQFLLAGPSGFICDQCAELAGRRATELKAAKQPEHLVSEAMRKPPPAHPAVDQAFTASVGIKAPLPAMSDG